jgi:hypothetical protein
LAGVEKSALLERLPSDEDLAWLLGKDNSCLELGQDNDKDEFEDVADKLAGYLPNDVGVDKGALCQGLKSFQTLDELIGASHDIRLDPGEITKNPQPFAEGNFGKAYFGQLQGRPGQVVVKCFKRPKGMDTQQLALDEQQEIMQLLRVRGHPRFVQLLHTYRAHRAGPWSLVTEKAEFGSLEKLYCRKYVEDEGRWSPIPPCRDALLAPACVMVVARDLAEGLSELHKRGYIHRDLAARNALLDRYSAGGGDGAGVRICDFGRMRNVKVLKLYRTHGLTPEPELQVHATTAVRASVVRRGGARQSAGSGLETQR